VSARSSDHSAAYAVEAALPVPPPLPHLWAASGPGAAGSSSTLPLRRTGLCALLAATARRHPERIAFVDGADKAAWSGRPALTLSYGTAAAITARIARGLRAWRLAPGSRIGLFLPATIEGLVAHLAIEAAGHVPCPLPLVWTEAQLEAGIQAAGVSAVLTQVRLGSARPAEAFCRVAARYFGLRYLAAFGPEVPDGVLNLDELVLDRAEGPGIAETGGGLVTFAAADPARPVLRQGDALLAAAVAHLAAARIGPEERILSLVGASDLRGLVTGLAAALVAGACLETLPVFRSADLGAAMTHPVATHIVAPGFLEGRFAACLRPGVRAPGEPRSLSFLHRAPARLERRTAWGALGRAVQSDPMILDVCAFDEDAVLTCPRGPEDIAKVLDDGAPLRAHQSLLALRREADGSLAFHGQAVRRTLLHRGTGAEAGEDGWRVWRPASDETGLAAAA